MRFKPNNGIEVRFDHQYYFDDIPADVDFEIEQCGESFRLRGFGYGDLQSENGYGNGALFVAEKDKKKFIRIMEGRR